MSKSLAILILLLLPFSAFAQTPSSDVQDLAAKYHETKNHLIQTETEKRRILGSLYSIDQRMKKISQKKSRLTDEMLHVQVGVRDSAKTIAVLEQEIEQQKSQLHHRLRALYKLSGESYLAIMFSQNTSEGLDRTLKYMKIITDSDYQLLKSYQHNVSIYQEHRKKLNTEVQKLLALEGHIKQQESLLKGEHNSKTQVIAELDRSTIMHLNKIQSLRSKTQALQSTTVDEQLASLLKPSFFESKGQLPAPVSGPVIQDYGLVRDVQYKLSWIHKGWQYGIPHGTSVMAVFDGTVIHLGPVNGYGQTLIVDHGDHYYTVYSHLGKTRARLNQTVHKGDVVAEAGAASRSGLANESEGFYFEIRHFSDAEDPKQWINQRNVKVTSTLLERGEQPQ
jgi:septal ring factor EnvC (AmiA/AmiB activator)